jgi:eukaryotic-like serine/threonine-protein kinase
MSRQINQLYKFGPFWVDSRECLLTRDGKPIAVTPKAFETLLVLVQNSGHLMFKEELLKAVWPDSFVEEVNLSQNVSVLRRALGDTAQESRYIVTVPGKGYRFIAEVKAVQLDEAEQDSLVVEQHSRSQVVIEQTRPQRIRVAAGLVVALLIGLISVILFRYSRGVGKLTEKDTTVLADFANSTGDSVFDDTLKQALSVAVRQSSFLSILSDDKVAATLKLMTRPPDTPLTPEVAREVCQRTGSTIYIAGAIARLGGEYVLGLKAVNCQSGETLVQEQVTATGKEKVLNVLGDACARLRRQLGESLVQVQKFNKPLEEATTPSLEALQSLTRGLKKGAEGDYVAAIPFCRRAVGLDPKFARAYACLGATYRYIGETGLAIENSRKAYEFRNRASEREKFYIESMYFHGAGDLERADQTCKEWIQAYPKDATPYAFLALSYENKGQFDQAVAQAMEEVRITREGCAAYTNLVSDYVSLNQTERANAAFEEARSRKVDCPSLRWAKYLASFLRRDVTGMQEQMTWATSTPGAEDYMMSVQSDTEAYFGHLAKARELTERSAVLARHADSPETAAYYVVSEALRDVEIGDLTRARREATESLALSSGRDVAVGAALTFARLGDTARMQKLAGQLNQDFPLDTMMQDYTLPTIRAALEVQKHHWGKAIDVLKVVSPYELGGTSALGAFYPAYVRGQALLELGQAHAAIAEFQKLSNHPGVVANNVIGALADLQMARAYRAAGEKKNSLTEYQGFLTLWKDADPNIPILKAAKREYATLQ